MKCGYIAFAIIGYYALACQDDGYSKHKRLGEIAKQITQLQDEADGLIREINQGDLVKHKELMRLISDKYSPEYAARRSSR